MLLYHYCSNDTFLSILRNSELWLSELTLSNDSMEGIWVREVLLEECRERNLSPHALNDFAEKTTLLLEVFSAAGFCLSAKGDLLSQWRGYADNGAGVAIGFDRKTLEKLCEVTKENGMGAFLDRVIYKRQKQRAAIQPHADELINSIESGVLSNQTQTPNLLYLLSNGFKNDVENLLFLYICQYLNMISLLFSLKNPAFSEEKEWRILSTMSKTIPDGKSIKGGDYSNPQRLDFRARGDHIVPYLPLKIPDDKKGCIREIILGPRNRTPEPVIRAALEKFGFHDVTIRRSAATYR